MQQQLWHTFFQGKEQLEPKQVKELTTLLLQQITPTQEASYWELWQWFQKQQLLKKGTTSLKEVLITLLSYKELDLKYSQLQELPTNIGLLWGLQQIDGSHNQLQHLPISIGQLPLLKTLVLSHNHLHSIPESIGQILTLQQLELAHNSLEELPDSIAWLQQLELVDLADNKLLEVPPDFAWLKQLRKLNLSNNAIVRVPQFITQKDTPVQVALKGNPLTPAALALLSSSHKL